ncbi:MAG TPA: efflux RND transporter permease subunit [Caulobacterales bacterium]|nr:efflux RND transporter permease subunit [Caulobacterales bacterium]
MVLSDISVRRPVLATVMSLIIIVFGAIAFFKLPLRELPDVDQPVVGVDVSYGGASAQVIETQITRPIENQLSGIEGIDTISSASRDGRGSVNITFKLERDLEAATNDVRNAVARARNSMPIDADEPIVSKADADASPIIWYSVTSKQISRMELSDYVQRVIAERLATIDGVSTIRMGGQLKPAMKVWIDPAGLAARGLTVDDIESAIRRQNVETPAGYLEGLKRDYTLRVERSFATPEEFARIAISRDPNGPSVRLGDVARVELAPEDTRRVFRANGVDAVGVGIVRQSKANSLDVAKAVAAEVAEIRKTLPAGMSIDLTSDNTVFISQAIHEVYKTLGEAIALVVLVIFLFLGSFRAAAIPAAVIPVCMIGVFAVLAIFGFSINLLTLLALVLSIGIVVDDSIVVLENIQRRVDDGEPTKVAALRGAGEVAFAVIATSAVMVAVFTPLLFIGGYVGKLFTELAATVAGVVVISAFCSLSLTPMMCSKTLRPVGQEGWLIRRTNEILGAVRTSYRESLIGALNNKIGVYAIFGFVFLMGAYLYSRLPSELVPKEDRGFIMISMAADEGTNFATAKSVMDQAEEITRSYVATGEVLREITLTPGFAGAQNFTSGQSPLFLAPWNKRSRSAVELMGELETRLARITGATFRVNSPDAISSGGGGSKGGAVSIALGGPEYEPLAALAERVVARLRTSPNFLRPLSDFEPNSPRVVVDIDRERAAALGVSVQAVGRALEATMGSRRVNTFTRNGEEYYVYLQAERSERSEMADLTDKYVRSDTTGQLIPLASVVTSKTQGDQSTRPRLNRMAAVQISANLPPGVAMGTALNEMEKVIREEMGSQSVQLSYTGAAKAFKDASGAIVFTFCFALLIVFLVLAAQFESFVHPLVIMMTVPLAVTGGLFGLYAFGSSLNIYSQIGIIILIALAAKNGILIVEFANQLRDRGKSIRDAITTSAELRLRPILMTSTATAFGAVPLLFGSGAGAESRHTIGVVIVFGVVLATVLTLFVVPTFYDLMARFTRSPEANRKEIEGIEDAGVGAPHAHPAE